MQATSSEYACKTAGARSAASGFLPEAHKADAGENDVGNAIFTRRSHLEIRMDILRAVRRGASKPTQIMYRANLSWNSLSSHLDLLHSKALVMWSQDGSRRHYELTTRGEQVISAYSKLLEDLGTEVKEPIFPF
jgi:predicted transcriptional regulator